MITDLHNGQGQETDEDIMHAYLQNADMNLLGRLYTRYMHMVYGVSMRYLKNREDSQDCVTQVFEVLVRDIHRFEIRNFKSWLYTVTKNQCLMKLRKDKKFLNNQALNFSSDFMESTAIAHPIDEPGSEEMIASLAECMEQLNSWQRGCVEQFYYEMKCYKEIAANLKLNENKVKSYIQNGKRNLKICMEKKEVVKNV